MAHLGLLEGKDGEEGSGKKGVRVIGGSLGCAILWYVVLLFVRRILNSEKGEGAWKKFLQRNAARS